MAAVETQGLVKRYDTVEALRGVSLTVEAGETFGILGPNGAGKTTLISILCTMLRPTAGDALVAGHSVTRQPERVRRTLGVVFQRPTLDGVLSARENLWIHGRLYKVPKRELRERIPQLLDLAGLGDRASEPVSQFSGGMRRRVEVVRAILHRPQVLLLDEPTVGLDPQSRRALWEHIAQLADELHMTVLLTTHYMDEADALCDRIAIIDHGEVGVIDAPDALKGALGGDALVLTLDPASEWAASLVAALPNVAAVRPVDGGLHVLLREPASAIPAIIQTLGDEGVVVTSMEHRPATLDDVFLATTGSKPRDRPPRPKRARRGLLGLLRRGDLE